MSIVLHNAIDSLSATASASANTQSFASASANDFSGLNLVDVADAVERLRAGAEGEVVVIIDAEHPDAGPASFLPVCTWSEIFQSAGFELVEPPVQDELERASRRRVPWLDRLRTRLSKTRKVHVPGRCIVFRLRPVQRPDRTLTRESIERLLDIDYRSVKRRQYQRATGIKVGINVHLFQDFLNQRPVLDVLDPRLTTVFLRKNMMPADAYAATLSEVRMRGFQTVEYDCVRDIPWQDVQVDVMFSITEGSANVTHCLGRQLIEAAKLHGARTLTFQHGIRMRKHADRFLDFGSEYHVTWGDEHDTFLSSPHRVAGFATTTGSASDGQTLPFGCAKFSDSLLVPNADVVRTRLGIDPSRYRRSVLIGTNLNWGAHRAERSNVIDSFRRVIQQNNDVLFILKTHPGERTTDYESLTGPNVVVLDDVLMTRMDLSTSRLINGVDLVVSSLSTLLLDAAVAGKHYLQYATGNRYAYQFVQPVPLGELPSLVANFELPGSLEADQFRWHYASAVDDRFFERLAGFLADLPAASVDETHRSLTIYSQCSVIESVWRESRRRGIA